MLKDRSDLDLIKEVKEKSDSEALTELVHRHTGVYIGVIQRYTYVDEVARQDLIDSKLYGIYQAALSYNPEKGMKFSSYVGECAKYECKTLISDRVHTTEVDENLAEEKIETPDTELCQLIISRAKRSQDRRFVEIFRRRHLLDTKQSWRRIGQDLHLSRQGALDIYNKGVADIRKHLPSK